jgi:hypothetical protein
MGPRLGGRIKTPVASFRGEDPVRHAGASRRSGGRIKTVSALRAEGSLGPLDEH